MSNLIYFSGMEDEEINRILHRYPSSKTLKVIPAGELVVLVEGWTNGVMCQLRQMYDSSILKFPSLSESEQTVAIPVCFNVKGHLARGVSDHIAVLYINAVKKQAYFLCNLKPSLYRDVVRTSIMKRVRYVYGDIQYKWLSLGKVHQYKYPDGCALLSLWLIHKLLDLPYEEIPKLRFPNLMTMHRFRKSLILTEDREKENIPPKNT